MRIFFDMIKTRRKFKKLVKIYKELEDLENKFKKLYNDFSAEEKRLFEELAKKNMKLINRSVTEVNDC